MKLEVAMTRGIVKIKDLKSGDLFLYENKIGVRTEKIKYYTEHCDCVEIGTGKQLFDWSMGEEEWNEKYVTIIKIYYK